MAVAIWIRELISPVWPIKATTLVIAASCLLFMAGPVMGQAAGMPSAGSAEPPPQAESLADIGTGTLLWGPPGSRQSLPMLDLQVDIALTGLMVHGTVIQAFENATAETIEALYVFPLPENAAVHHMEIRIGQRRIVSVIQEKEAARRTYDKAREAGRKAALLEQERPNLFTTAVAGVNPGETVQVHLEYVEELAYDDGAFQLVFPLTYTPRYGPRASSQAAPGGTLATQEPMARADAPRAHLTVRLKAGLPLEEPESDSHAITWRWENELMIIEPASRAPVPANRDFHLQFVPQVGHEPEAALLTEDRDEGRYALLMVLPSLQAAEKTGLATETLFVVDTSGSMSGPSMEQARTALVAAIDRLHTDDTFNILAFSNSVISFARDYVPAGEIERTQARLWIQDLAADGGTRMDLALESGLQMVERDEGWRVERMVFLTDGAISTEDALLERIRSRLGSARLHTLGIGAAPNRYLMRRMASAGQGLCEFISRVDQAENQIDTFLKRLSRPVMTDITLTWEGEQPLELYPQRLPDLHAGEPLILSARFAPGGGQGRLLLDGRLAGTRIRRVLDVGAGANRPAGIATRWARHKIDDLMGSLHAGAEPDSVRQAVIDVSHRFGVVTRYTSLVAVEEYPTASGESHRVQVANAAPLAGQLPLGGTQGPLMRLLMYFFAVAAGVTGLAGRILRRHRCQVPR